MEGRGEMKLKFGSLKNENRNYEEANVYIVRDLCSDK